ncbi:MAG: sulfotransferase [Candidatus Paceibacterota bacterium]
MKLKPLYISAPSRSGSSLLIKILNCTTNMSIVNEPLNSVNISDRSNITTIFNFIEESLRYGFMMQRIDIKGLEVTDTFPPSKTRWGMVKRSLDGMRIVGIKKSFPAFSNKDFFQLFIQEWPDFVKWMNKDLGGGVIVIVRDPKFTILSWKTTFDALKEGTKNQCLAWNLIADTILSSRSLGVHVVRYEDLIQNQTATVERIATHLGIELDFKEKLPKIKQSSLEDFFGRRSDISSGSLETEFRIIEDMCGETARKFGY